MRIPSLKIGQLEFKLPIVQGAMGVQVSSYPLPAASGEARNSIL
jgi:NAD(P)H-dependent flavin oxidoreductase YrpB (nitropropane dioxygenase family)